LNEKTVRKYDFIDTLRGLAILGVILIHTAQWIPPSNPVLNTIAYDGAQGVQLFFIASALTLFLSLRSRQASESKPVRNFFIRRFFRIAPMYYVALIFFVVVDGFGKRYFAPFGVPWYYPLLTATFLNGWHPETINSIIPGGWSISVEMTFYLFVPFLFVFLKDIKRTLLFIMAALLVGWLLNALMTAVYTPKYPQDDQYLVSSFTFFWFFSQLPVFGIGILTYHLFERWKGIQDRGLGIVLLIATVFVEWAFLDTSTYGELIPHHVMMALGFVFGVFGLYFSNLRLLINPVTVWIGKLSFSMYLVHFAILRLLQEVIFPKGFPIGGDLGMWAGYILIAELTVVISVVTYHYIEKPGMDLGKALINRLETAHAYAHAPSKESQ
jgi:peptidoglycan/LPS O-acetylase OafA/YrhL